MYGVNLDLLRTLPHHPDGRPKDPHAHHRAAHKAAQRRTRAAVWNARLSRLRTLIFPSRATGLPVDRPL